MCSYQNYWDLRGKSLNQLGFFQVKNLKLTGITCLDNVKKSSQIHLTSDGEDVDKLMMWSSIC